MSDRNELSRRSFTKTVTAGAVLLGSAVGKNADAAKGLRLGGPVHEKYDSPDEWVAALKRLGFSAAYCPVGADQSDDTIKAYAQAAKKANIIIAEVGAWSNPMDPNDAKRKQALDKCKTQLALAERIGANCCVNICGSRGDEWAGHDPKNFTQETFDMIVETTRSIIDAVKPTRTYYSLETMPWAYPDSADSYLRLIKAIDREGFCAHLDPVNLVCSPQRYYSTGALIRECFAKLGPSIRSCHAKDIILRQQLTTHLDEIRPGLGNLDYGVFLKELSRLSDIPLMLEHLPNAEEYKLAAEHVRSVAKKEGFSFL